MNAEEQVQLRAEAAAEFDRHEHRNDGDRVAGSLTDGLNMLRELFVARVSVDLEQEVGMDSMLSPVSALKTEARAKAEIDIYQIAEVCVAVRERNYATDVDGWFEPWLTRLRLGDFAASDAVTQRLTHYRGRGPDDRRRAFVMVLERTIAEARQAPLIIYRLQPLAVSIVAASAFNDYGRAAEDRKRQVALLPGIGDCHHCRGGMLEIGEKCGQCGNPMWKYDWLTAE